MKTKAVVALSGGMDSTTVLANSLDKDRDVVMAVAFNYGSKHNLYENEAAIDVANFYGVDFRLIDLTNIAEHLKSNLLLSGGDIPEGYYEAENMRQTVVPGRNLIFISILTGIAWSMEAKEVWLGIHAGDHFIYPDCRPEFFDHISMAVEDGTERKVELRAPYLMGTKVDILKDGFKWQVPYELTRTCYKAQVTACGKCGACQERLTAFAAHHVTDPLEYETRELVSK